MTTKTKTLRKLPRIHHDRVRIIKDMGQDWVDAKADLRLFITQRDCNRAVPGDPNRCVIAQTLRHTLGGEITNFEVRNKTAIIRYIDANGNPVVERYYLGKRARQIVLDNDAGKPVAPQEITLKRPHPSMRAEARQNEKFKRRERERQKALRGGRRVSTNPARRPKSANVVVGPRITTLRKRAK